MLSIRSKLCRLSSDHEPQPPCHVYLARIDFRYRNQDSQTERDSRQHAEGSGRKVSRGGASKRRGSHDSSDRDQICCLPWASTCSGLGFRPRHFALCRCVEVVDAFREVRTRSGCHPRHRRPGAPRSSAGLRRIPQRSGFFLCFLCLVDHGTCTIAIRPGGTVRYFFQLVRARVFTRPGIWLHEQSPRRVNGGARRN